MSIERTYYCDNADCADDKPGDGTEPARARTASPPPYLPKGIMEVREHGVWACLHCPYMNVGTVCTKCGHPREGATSVGGRVVGGAAR